VSELEDRAIASSRWIRRRDQVLEALDELGFPQSQIIQYFDERHQHNFVRVSTFANANPYRAIRHRVPKQKRRPKFRTPL
jgi:hypothetical protein